MTGETRGERGWKRSRAGTEESIEFPECALGRDADGYVRDRNGRPRHDDADRYECRATRNLRLVHISSFWIPPGMPVSSRTTRAIRRLRRSRLAGPDIMKPQVGSNFAADEFQRKLCVLVFRTGPHDRRRPPLAGVIHADGSILRLLQARWTSTMPDLSALACRPLAIFRSSPPAAAGSRRILMFQIPSSAQVTMNYRGLLCLADRSYFFIEADTTDATASDNRRRNGFAATFYRCF